MTFAPPTKMRDFITLWLLVLALAVLLFPHLALADAAFDDALAAYKSGNYKEAVKWWRKAAAQGDALAQTRLGFMYSRGEGVPQDYAEALKWYRKAAEQGYAAAQFNLGVMYGNGQGVPQDYVTAHMWSNLAAAQGNSPASKLRDIVAKKMSSTDISKAQKLAREWAAKKRP